MNDFLYKMAVNNEKYLMTISFFPRAEIVIFIVK